MKKLTSLLVALLLIFTAPAFANAVDLSSMTYEELLELRAAVDAEIAARDAASQSEAASQNSDAEPASSTDGEILFRSMPWDTTPNAFANAISADAKAANVEWYGMWTETMGQLTAYKDDGFFFFGTYSVDAPTYEYTAMSLDKALEVGGIPIAWLQAYAVPLNTAQTKLDDTQIVYASYYLSISKYSDQMALADGLRDKLTSLYGEPTVARSAAPQVNYIWYGANDTYCQLYGYIDSSNSEYSSLNLTYGKTNAAEIIAPLKASPDAVGSGKSDL